jgi:hypothetical protein
MLEPKAKDSDEGAGQLSSPARRAALARLGLAAAVAYAAPTLVHLDRSYAKVHPSKCNHGHGRGDDNGCHD